MAWFVEESGRDRVTCATLDDARQYVEDRAVEIWEALRDPNQPGPQSFEGVAWRHPLGANYGNTEWRILGEQQ